MQRVIEATSQTICFALLCASAPLLAAKPPAGPTAELILVKGYDKGVGLGRASIQDYRVLRETDSLKSKSLGSFAWTSGPTKSVLLPIAKLVRFEARTTYLANDQSADCRTRFAFAPATGGRYQITHIAQVPIRCFIEVIDLDTGAPPPDLAAVDLRDCIDPARLER